MPTQDEVSDERILTDETTEFKAVLTSLLEIALTKRKVSLGGKQVTERVDLSAAIRILELKMRLLELEQPPIAKLLAIIAEAPDNVVDAWLTVNKYIMLPKAHAARARRPPFPG